MSTIGTHLKNEIKRRIGHIKCAACERTCKLLNKMTVEQVERHQWKIVAQIERNAMSVKCGGWKSALRDIDQSLVHGAGLRHVITGLLAAAITEDKTHARKRNGPREVLDSNLHPTDMDRMADG